MAKNRITNPAFTTLSTGCIPRNHRADIAADPNAANFVGLKNDPPRTLGASPKSFSVHAAAHADAWKPAKCLRRKTTL